MTRGHLLPSLRRSPPPLHGAPRDQVRCLTQLTAGSQVTQGEVTRGASPPHTLLEAAQPRARPPRSLSLPGRKELRPQPQVHPGLFQGQLLSVPGEVPAAQRGPLLTTTGEAAPESASAPGCPEVGLGPSSWAVGTPPPRPLCLPRDVQGSLPARELGHRYTNGPRTRGPGGAVVQMAIQGKHCNGWRGLVPVSPHGRGHNPEVSSLGQHVLTPDSARPGYLGGL